MSVDLGQRAAAAYAVIAADNQASESNKPRRFIGSADGKDWRAFVEAMGVLRLPGEDKKFFYEGNLKIEPYGSKGRKASEDELKETEDVIVSLLGKEESEKLLGKDEEPKNLSFPELNDKTLRAIRSAQSRLYKYYRWLWMLGESGKKQTALKEIKEQEEMKSWKDLAKEGESKAQHLQVLIKGAIPQFQKSISENLLKLAGRILPIRGGKWEWIQHPHKKNFCLLRLSKETDTSKKKIKKIYGQRGLSMRRIEQIEELRRRFQSLNQTQRRKPGAPPLKLSERRDDSIPDPCPDILKKLEEIKRQRVNQTAHLILAEALGVKLKPPSLSDEKRRKQDIHGEYEKIRDPVNFIVIEDLSRYLMRQDRPPSENRKLMQWSHRAVTEKLKQLCEPYGIPVLDAVAAYSSKFCSRSGVPGFRAEEVTIKDKIRYPYKDWLQKENEEDTEHKDRREFLEDLFMNLEKNPKRTGLIPKEGGPIFIPIKMSGMMQADINAAINIGLRAIASPMAEKIHHRVRAEKSKKGGKITVKKSGSIEKRRYQKETDITIKDPKEEDKITKHAVFFIDIFNVSDFEKAEIKGVRYSSAAGIWTAVKRGKWDRCKEMNDKSLNKQEGGA